MTFARPLVLLPAIAIVLALALAYRAGQRRRAAQALAYSNLAFALEALAPARWPAAVLFGSYVVGVGALLGSLAGPHLLASIPIKDGAVVLCIDTSGSMRARDVAPTRADAARSAAASFLSAVPDGTRVGIVTFSTGARLVQGLTPDLDAAREALDRIPAPGGATAIGDALMVAAEEMPGTGKRVIVLMTDGVNNRGVDPLEASRTIGSRGIAIETVGVGTSDSGEIIPGTTELANLDADALRAIAENGHGRYVEARDAASLRSAFAGIARRTVWQKKRVDASLAVALSGGACLVIAFLVGLSAGRFP